MKETFYEAKHKYVGARARHYLKGRSQKLRWRSEHEIIERLVSENMQPGESVLDVPFGTGRFASLYRDRDVSVTAVDISKDMLDIARAEIGPQVDQIEMVVADALDMPFRDEAFDHVVCVRLLGHLPERLVIGAVKEFKRVARRTITVHIPVRDNSIGRMVYRILRWLPYVPGVVLRVVLGLIRGIPPKVNSGRGRQMDGESLERELRLNGWRIRSLHVRKEGSDGHIYFRTPVRIYTIERVSAD